MGIAIIVIPKIQYIKNVKKYSVKLATLLVVILGISRKIIKLLFEMNSMIL